MTRTDNLDYNFDSLGEWKKVFTNLVENNTDFYEQSELFFINDDEPISVYDLTPPTKWGISIRVYIEFLDSDSIRPEDLDYLYGAATDLNLHYFEVDFKGKLIDNLKRAMEAVESGEYPLGAYMDIGNEFVMQEDFNSPEYFEEWLEEVDSAIKWAKSQIKKMVHGLPINAKVMIG